MAKLSKYSQMAVDAIFTDQLGPAEMKDHLHMICALMILTLLKIEGREFMLGFLQASINDIKSGRAFDDIKRLSRERVH